MPTQCLVNNSSQENNDLITSPEGGKGMLIWTIAMGVTALVVVLLVCYWCWQQYRHRLRNTYQKVKKRQRAWAPIPRAQHEAKQAQVRAKLEQLE